MYSRYIRELAEAYGYTPEEVGKLTVYQVNVLYAKDGEAAKSLGAGTVAISATNYNLMNREQRRRFLFRRDAQTEGRNE